MARKAEHRMLQSIFPGSPRLYVCASLRYGYLYSGEAEKGMKSVEMPARDSLNSTMHKPRNDMKRYACLRSDFVSLFTDVRSFLSLINRNKLKRRLGAYMIASNGVPCESH